MLLSNVLDIRGEGVGGISPSDDGELSYGVECLISVRT